jgi:hypothetical protein
MLRGVKGNTNNQTTEDSGQTAGLRSLSSSHSAAAGSSDAARGARLNSGLPSVFACATQFSPAVNSTSTIH